MAKKFDVIVIGAGPAGSVATAYLQKQGKKVLVLEKMKFPRFVIGESLLPHSMDYLEKVDLVQTVHDQKFQLKTGVTFYHNEEVCQFLFKDQYTQGWNYTYQVKRADFDKALIDKVAERDGVEVLFEAEVLAVETSKEVQKVTYTYQGETFIAEARFIMDASGYGRVLPRLFNLDKPVVTPPRSAIFCHIEDEHRTSDAAQNIFVHAFENNTAWIWSIPFSDNTASVGVVGNTAMVDDYEANDSEKFKKLVYNFPGLEERFAKSKFKFETRKITNYAVSVDKLYGEGFVLCGNSTEFLDPIFSSGVTLAISSGYKAAEMVNKQLDGENVDWDENYAKVLKAGINVFRSYVNAWYDGTLGTIFFTKDPNEEFKKQICSVLAGYVWDETNPFVKRHDKLLHKLAKVIEIQSTPELN